MQQSIVTLFGFLAATSMAMPNSDASSNLVARFGECKTSADCAAGSCCSQFGFCGTGADFCGAGDSTAPPAGGDAPATGGDAPADPPAGGNDSSAPPPSTGGGSDKVSCTSRQLFKGDGSTGAGWPSDDTWVSFDTLWNINLQTLTSSCTQFNAENNSDEEIDQIKSAIENVAKSSGVDSRFILATVMQESKGCVRVPTTSVSVANPGLMQDHAGTHDCTNTNPCPNDQILGMIQDGTSGTASGDGLQQILANLKTTGSQQVYQAARIYNSGSIPPSGDLSEGGATSSYASDIADRLGGCVF